MDKIVRYISDEGIRLSIAVTTNTVEEGRRRHDLWPVATAALGRTMTGALLLAGDFKNEENVSVRIKGDGPLGAIHVDAFADSTVRGYVDVPHIDLPLTDAGKLNVGGAVGHEGEVQVTRFTRLTQDYSSRSPLYSGEIAEDLAHYLYMSEQVPSTISLGVLVNPDGSASAAGGFLVQAMPGAKDEALQKIEENIKNIGTITQYLVQYKEAEGLAEKIMAGLTYKEVFTHPVSFSCTCSRERFEGVLMTLAEKDKADLLQDETTELVCHYCNEKYHYSRSELERLFAQKPGH